MAGSCAFAQDGAAMTASEDDALAAREAQSADLERFEGGDAATAFIVGFFAVALVGTVLALLVAPFGRCWP